MRNKYMGADLQARLHGTVIRYRQKPYMCIVDGPDVQLRDLVTSNTVARVSPTDSDLDISSLPLGYVNYGKGKSAVHVRRDPVRRYKQGVDPQNMNYMTLSDKHAFYAEVFNDKGFQENCSDNYPDYRSALKTLTEKGWDSIALSRDVALWLNRGTIKVYVTTDEVGFIRLKSGTDNSRCSIRKTDVSWVIRSKLERLGIIAEEGL